VGGGDGGAVCAESIVGKPATETKVLASAASLKFTIVPYLSL
jgi:hypothetical protein